MRNNSHNHSKKVDGCGAVEKGRGWVGGKERDALPDQLHTHTHKHSVCKQENGLHWMCVCASRAVV